MTPRNASQSALERELGGDGGFQEKHADKSGTPTLPLVALTLNPYYLCPWGKKKILGKRVEEGEGLGPRKELFELAAAQFTERWRPVLPSRCGGTEAFLDHRSTVCHPTK